MLKNIIKLVVAAVLGMGTVAVRAQVTVDMSSDGAAPETLARGGTAAQNNAVAGGVLELRSEATILGGDVLLRQLGRWKSSDNGFFSPVRDLVVARFEPGQKTLTVNVDQVRTLLDGAGVGGGAVSFRGAVRVVVTRLDAEAAVAKGPPVSKAKDLGEFLDKGGAPVPVANGAKSSDAAVEVAPARETKVEMNVVPKGPVVTLKQALIKDISLRLGVKPEELEVSFDAADERVLQLSEPAFSWSFTTIRAKSLGAVQWAVTLWSGGAEGKESREVAIKARARMWTNQVKVVRPLGRGQVVTAEDIEESRVLVDSTPDEMPVNRKMVLMMQAERQIVPGTLLTARMLSPMLMVKQGQAVTVTVKQGAFELKMVGRSKDNAVYLGSVRVRMESTGQEVQATVTGPQEASVGPVEKKDEVASVQETR